jgi:phenylalanyl-tRNA synthetase beta chain
MKVPLSWLREFVDVSASARDIGERMSIRGLALEGLEQRDGDVVFDFDVTANRPDCLSVVGIAREIATAFRLPLRVPAPSRPAPVRSADVPVRIDDPDLCARYVAAVADVAIAPSPAWMQARLAACGIRPISNVVDVTNYVLLERGYPMHAFDADRLAGPAIVVRRARPGETITTLDGRRRELEPDMLVIADAERPQAIGGVMGGADSEVGTHTRRIVLEAAWFLPRSIRSTSKRLGLKTEASYRFERGVDLTATAEAMARALELLEKIGAGRAASPITDCYKAPHVERHVMLDAATVARVLGMEVPEDEAVRILESLGFHVRTLGGWHAEAPEAATPLGQPGHAWQVTVPGWRVDVQRPIDLIEEVGRHYGFEHLPGTFPSIEAPPQPSDPQVARDQRVRLAVAALGFNEAITFSFLDDAAAGPFAEGDGLTRLANPLSEKFSTLRPSLLPGLIDAVSHNRRHGRRDVRLFEIGTRFSSRGEARSLAAVWTGAALPEHWSGSSRDVDFFDMKGTAEYVCALFAVQPVVAAVTRPYLVEGRAAALRVDGELLGIVGQLAPEIAAARDLPADEPIYVVELDLDCLARHAPSAPRLTRPLPRHPAIVRDLALLIDDTLSADTVRGTIRAAAPATLVDVREFDRYQGRGIPEGKVSLALRLTFQAPDRTLTDAEIHAAMERIVADLKDRLGAIQR